MIPRIIGLGHQARAGKDTVAQFLNQHYGYQRVSFGDQVRRVASVLTGEDAFHPSFKTDINQLGLTGGQLLQQVGEGMRQILGEGIWAKMANVHYRLMTEQLLVIPDVRYLSEAELIRSLGGRLYKVSRPGLPYDNHISETQGASIVWDGEFVNAGSLADLEAQVLAELQRLQALS